MKVTKDNFELAMRGLFYGHELSDYNSECFSSRDIQLHIACGERCQKAIDAIRTAGYEPKYLLEPVFEKYLPHVKFFAEPNPTLKSQMDDEFEIEVDSWQVEWGNEWYVKYKKAQ